MAVMLVLLILLLVVLIIIFAIFLDTMRSVLRGLQDHEAIAEHTAKRAEQKASNALVIAEAARVEANSVRGIITPTKTYPTCKKCGGTGHVEVMVPSPLVAEIHASLVKRFGK